MSDQLHETGTPCTECVLVNVPLPFGVVGVCNLGNDDCTRDCHENSH